MDKFLYQLGICDKVIDTICKRIDIGVQPDQILYKELYDELQRLLPLMPESLCLYKERLEKRLLPNLKLPDLVKTDGYGHQYTMNRSGINPYVFGQIIATKCYIKESLSDSNKTGFWQSIHKDVLLASKELFDNGHYAEAVENAIIELTVKVKHIVREKTGKDQDGVSAIQTAFSLENPIIKISDSRDTKTGRDIQIGFMNLCEGAVKFIRNPKVHEKVTYERSEAIQNLHFISFLLDRIDKSMQEE